MEWLPGSWGHTRKTYCNEEVKKSDSDYYKQGLLFSSAASPGQCSIQIPVDRLWDKWIFIRCTNFQQRRFKGEGGWQVGASGT